MSKIVKMLGSVRSAEISRLGHRAEKFLGGCFEDRADTENFLGSPSRAENSSRLGSVPRTEKFSARYPALIIILKVEFVESKF